MFASSSITSIFFIRSSSEVNSVLSRCNHRSPREDLRCGFCGPVFRERQPDREEGTSRVPVPQLDLSLVGLDYPVGNRQTKPRATRFRRIVGVENIMHCL